MGVVFPTSVYTIDEGDNPLKHAFETPLTTASTSLLRLDIKRVRSLVISFRRYQYPPMMDYLGLHSFFMDADKCGELTQEHLSLIFVLWKIYEDKTICYIQDLLAVLILLSDGSLRSRLELLFEVYRCSSSDELGYEDLSLAALSCALCLHKLWPEEEWHLDQWEGWTALMAEEAFAKVGKDVEEGLQLAEFLQWAESRFDASLLLTSPDALHALYAVEPQLPQPGQEQHVTLDGAGGDGGGGDAAVAPA